jgi:hypothetical protein
MRVYAAKKKFDINGAIALSSPIKMKLKSSTKVDKQVQLETLKYDLPHRNNKSQNISPYGFVIFSKSLGKPLNFRIKFVLAECLKNFWGGN